MKQNYKLNLTGLLATLFLLGLFSCAPEKTVKDDTPRKIEVLFLGHDQTHHNSSEYAPMLTAALGKSGINFTYTTDLNDLHKDYLNHFDAILIYANHEAIGAAQEIALLQFVEEGGGLVPVHCASFCFQNSDAYIDLVGAQFKEHGEGTFTANITQADHQAIAGVTPFETWDETYIHHRHNQDRTVLMERVDGDHREPWTWVRKYGNGRVFYTAYGHDERTWNQPAFQELIEKGILWAVGEKVGQLHAGFTIDDLSYSDAVIPNYEKRDPPPKLQEPLSPELSQKFIQIPPGFELQLFASEPDIVNPITMAWDERGRLWVVETVDYPNSVRADDGQGDDQIKICEDTDGDGKADKFTVFAQGLNIPTSMVFANDGVIVSQAPHTLFLKDTNGDDKADERKVLFTGWGVSDTHAGPSNFKYGFDNKIWGTVGYSRFEGTVGGEDFNFGQSLYRFETDGSKMEYLGQTSNNTWGLGFSEDFNVFASTANNTHSVFFGIPFKYYAQVEGLPVQTTKKIDGHYAMHPLTPNVRQVDVFGGFTAAAGHSLYTARSFPQEYWNRVAFVSEPTGHLLHRAVIERDGAGFKEKDGWNILSSADEWVSPVQAEVGPDGALWILDWYNFIIQHNPTPEGFENGLGNAHINPLRDRKHGRIYRMTYKEAPVNDRIELSKNRPEELVAALNNDNMFWRLNAQRLLVERGEKDILPNLYSLIRNQKVDALGLNPGAIHALWTLHGLGALESDNDAYLVAKHALTHPSAGVRKAALQVLPRTPWANTAIWQSNIVDDPDLNVRLAAVLAVAEMAPSQKYGQWLYERSLIEENQNDPWISRALYCAATTHQEGFLMDYGQNQRAAGRGLEYETHYDDSNWAVAQLPGMWEGELERFKGDIWYRKQLSIPAGLLQGAVTLNLPIIDDSDKVWINGIKVGQTFYQSNAPRTYNIAQGILKKDDNVITIKISNSSWVGGMRDGADFSIQSGSSRVNLSGNWKSKVVSPPSEGGDAPFSDDKTIAMTLAQNYQGASASMLEGTTTAEMVPEVSEARTIRIKVVPNVLKYDLTGFNVAAGETVEIVFENPDFMQHNLLIAQPGSLETVGQAADALATTGDGADKDYVPAIPEVLFATKLVNPNEQVVLRFTAPDTPGDYPFVCTFPGHWRVMNGIMKVVANNEI